MGGSNGPPRPEISEERRKVPLGAPQAAETLFSLSSGDFYKDFCRSELDGLRRTRKNQEEQRGTINELGRSPP